MFNVPVSGRATDYWLGLTFKLVPAGAGAKVAYQGALVPIVCSDSSTARAILPMEVMADLV